jgi:hypothetical protein
MSITHKHHSYATIFNHPCFFYFQEDILGGHSAVGNITLRILNDLASQEQGLKTQQHIQVCCSNG